MDVFFDWRWWLIEKYNTIWDKVNSDITKDFDSESFCHKKNLKIKIKSYGDEFTDFHGKKSLRWALIVLV